LPIRETDSNILSPLDTLSPRVVKTYWHYKDLPSFESPSLRNQMSRIGLPRLRNFLLERVLLL
jgi:hypothetical protein